MKGPPFAFYLATHSQTHSNETTNRRIFHTGDTQKKRQNKEQPNSCFWYLIPFICPPLIGNYFWWLLFAKCCKILTIFLCGQKELHNQTRILNFATSACKTYERFQTSYWDCELTWLDSRIVGMRQRTVLSIFVLLLDKYRLRNSNYIN